MGVQQSRPANMMRHVEALAWVFTFAAVCFIGGMAWDAYLGEAFSSWRIIVGCLAGAQLGFSASTIVTIRILIPPLMDHHCREHQCPAADSEKASYSSDSEENRGGRNR